jgi:hypothetical protein
MEGPLFFQGPLCSLPDKTQRHMGPGGSLPPGQDRGVEAPVRPYP